LRAHLQKLIGDHKGGHGFHHGYSAGYNTRVVAAAGDQLNHLSIAADCVLLARNRGRRLEGDTRNDVLAIGQASLDAARPAHIIRKDYSITQDWPHWVHLAQWLERMAYVPGGEGSKISACRSASPAASKETCFAILYGYVGGCEPLASQGKCLALFLGFK
jgi:hypothetical protein